ncbi:hypothetical protein BJ944DRAFT_127845 [Cunninghamella echinulata]|nr:hypothetical protein BJ944DRAFT_127845 [Cunninghamella echinulata]
MMARKSKRKLLERKSIKSNILDINIPDSATSFEQEIRTKLLIASIAAPTIENDILKVEYSLRAVININDVNNKHHENYINLESSIIIGTFPKPDLCIDDDDDEVDKENGNEIMENEDIEPLAEEQDIIENSSHIEEKDDTNNKVTNDNNKSDEVSTASSSRLSIATTSPSTPSSATIIDPTFKRESSHASSPDNAHSHLHRHASAAAALSTSSSDSQFPPPGVRRTQSSFTPTSTQPISSHNTFTSNTMHQSNASSVNIPSPLNKTNSLSSSSHDHLNTTSNVSFPPSNIQSPPMANMPDISSYIPSKSSPSPHPSSISSPVFLCNTTAHLDDQLSPSGFPQPTPLSTSPSMITPIPMPTNSYSNNTNSQYNINNPSIYNNNTNNTNNINNNNNNYYNNNNNSNDYYNNNNNNQYYHQYNQPSYPNTNMPLPQQHGNNSMDMSNNNPQAYSNSFIMPDHTHHLPQKQQGFPSYPSQPPYSQYPAQQPYSQYPAHPSYPSYPSYPS